MKLSEESKKVLIDSIDSLPEELQILVIGGQLDYFVETVSQEHNLSEIQNTLLSNQLWLTLLALVSIDKFPRNLVSEANIEQSTARNILKKLIKSELSPLVQFVINVYTQSDDPSGKVIELIFGDGDGKSKQDYLNEELIKKYDIATEKTGNFIDVVENVTLGFNKISELPNQLQLKVGLSKEDAQRLTSELIDAWGPIVEREEAEATEKKESVASLADKIAAIKPQETEGVEVSHEEVRTPEPAKPIRTMQQDVDRAHGYGAPEPGRQSAPTDDEPVIKATPQDELRGRKLISSSLKARRVAIV